MGTHIQASIASLMGTVAGGIHQKRNDVVKARKEASKKPNSFTPSETPSAPAARSNANVKLSPQAAAADKAKQSSANEMTAKQTQRRNFMEYLKKEPTSLGGTVGEFEPDVQKKIANNYSKSQRKKLMDMRDAEAKNGKK